MRRYKIHPSSFILHTLIHNRQKLFAVRPAHRPLIFGHRGSPLEAQENTLASFELALAEGADGVELDVRLTGDHIPIVFHDEHLPSGEYVRDYSFAEILVLAENQGLTIFSLESILQQLAGRGFVNIEIKDELLSAIVVPMAAQFLSVDSYVFSSFLPDVIRSLSILAPDIPTIWIVEAISNKEQSLRVMNEIGAAGIAPWYETIDQTLADFFTAHGIPLFTFTVNDPFEARRLAALGVVGIISDVPGTILK